MSLFGKEKDPILVYEDNLNKKYINAKELLDTLKLSLATVHRDVYLNSFTSRPKTPLEIKRNTITLTEEIRKAEEFFKEIQEEMDNYISNLERNSNV